MAACLHVSLHVGAHRAWIAAREAQRKGETAAERGDRVSRRSLDSLGLKGSLPPDVSELGFLQVLNMSTNGFTGALPDSWGYPGAMPNLTVLLLDNNQLQGSLPSAWANTGSLQNLVLLNLGYNNLSGALTAMPLSGQMPWWGSPFEGLSR